MSERDANEHDTCETSTTGARRDRDVNRHSGIGLPGVRRSGKLITLRAMKAGLARRSPLEEDCSSKLIVRGGRRARTCSPGGAVRFRPHYRAKTGTKLFRPVLPSSGRWLLCPPRRNAGEVWIRRLPEVRKSISTSRPARQSRGGDGDPVPTLDLHAPGSTRTPLSSMHTAVRRRCHGSILCCDGAVRATDPRIGTTPESERRVPAKKRRVGDFAPHVSVAPHMDVTVSPTVRQPGGPFGNSR